MTNETSPQQLPLAAHLIGYQPYGAPQVPAKNLMNVNENPFGVPAGLIQELAERIGALADGWNRYPDREATVLRGQLAEYLSEVSPGLDLDADSVWVANGSNEILHQLLLAYGGPGHKVLIAQPTYSMYPQYARDTHTELISLPPNGMNIDVDTLLAAIREHQPQVVLVASPNNPTGQNMTNAELGRLAEACAAVPGGCVLLVDEAYAEFRDPALPTGLELLKEFPNVAISRTFSKAFSFAGLRVGYLAASPQIVAALRIVRLPYHLSSLTQVAAEVAMRHRGALLEQVALLRAERDKLYTWLLEQGLQVNESQANFLMFGEFADRDDVWQQLLDRDVLIRATGPKGWLRVSVGTPEENDAFRYALTEVLNLERQ